MEPTEPNESFERAAVLASRFVENVETVVHGKEDAVRLVLSALICGGHVLFEDVPGTGKTMLARAIAGSVAGRRKRGSSARPTSAGDMTGLSVFDTRSATSCSGPGRCSRTSCSSTRSTARCRRRSQRCWRRWPSSGNDRRRHAPAARSFLVLATENPIEQEGTFPLPEAQLDRFFLKTALGYPGEDDELRIVEEQVNAHPLATLGPVISLDDVNGLRRAVTEVYIDPLLRRWIIRLVRATREADGVAIGASVRGSLSLERASRAWALMNGRSFVTPVDVERLFLPVVMHRIVFTPSFVATAREIGWDGAAEAFRAQCADLAPRPDEELADVAVA